MARTGLATRELKFSRLGAHVSDANLALSATGFGPTGVLGVVIGHVGPRFFLLFAKLVLWQYVLDTVGDVLKRLNLVPVGIANLVYRL